MYLMKYIAAALVFFAALLYAIRTCRSTLLSRPRGKLCRVVLSLLALTLLGVVWSCSGNRNFSGIKVKYAARTASVLLYLFFLPDIWADGKAEEAPAAAPPTYIADAEPADGTSAEPADKAGGVPGSVAGEQAEDAPAKASQTKDETDRE